RMPHGLVLLGIIISASATLSLHDALPICLFLSLAHCFNRHPSVILSILYIISFLVCNPPLGSLSRTILLIIIHNFKAFISLLLHIGRAHVSIPSREKTVCRLRLAEKKSCY